MKYIFSKGIDNSPPPQDDKIFTLVQYQWNTVTPFPLTWILSQLVPDKPAIILPIQAVIDKEYFNGPLIKLDAQKNIMTLIDHAMPCSLEVPQECFSLLAKEPLPFEKLKLCGFSRHEMMRSFYYITLHKQLTDRSVIMLKKNNTQTLEQLFLIRKAFPHQKLTFYHKNTWNKQSPAFRKSIESMGIFPWKRETPPPFDSYINIPNFNIKE